MSILSNIITLCDQYLYLNLNIAAIHYTYEAGFRLLKVTSQCHFLLTSCLVTFPVLRNSKHLLTYYQTMTSTHDAEIWAVVRFCEDRGKTLTYKLL